MFFEEFIEFDLRRIGPPGRTCTPTTSYFHDKTKVSKESLRVDYYLLLKCCKWQCTLFPLLGPNHLQIKFNSKMQDLKRVLNLNCKEKKD